MQECQNYHQNVTELLGWAKHMHSVACNSTRNLLWHLNVFIVLQWNLNSDPN